METPAELLELVDRELEYTMDEMAHSMLHLQVKLQAAQLRVLLDIQKKIDTLQMCDIVESNTVGGLVE